MKISDYIVSFLIEKGITDVFGYPGGMVTHLMDSFEKYKKKISAHVNYHEQAAAFCACGYGQVANKPGIAYATSGPGATNLITGIANAYFDSAPCIFITGQVNTYEAKGDLEVRQKGFQETDIVSIVKSITKYAVQVTKAEDIRYELEKAFHISMEGRPGPVLLDIPMNIQRADVIPEELTPYICSSELQTNEHAVDIILKELQSAKKPVILGGHGVAISGLIQEFRTFVNLVGVPVVTSMTGKEIIATDNEYNFGFIGAYGDRYANFIISNSDLIISIGSRLDCRQTGNNLDIFAVGAKIIRIDIDEKEIEHKIKEDEINIISNLKDLLPKLTEEQFAIKDQYVTWLEKCKKVREKLETIDVQDETKVIKKLARLLPEETVITTDVGQNQVWVAQALHIKNKQRVLFSGGHGAMGYSLPAAIGAYYASHKPVICFNGDGGLQMNIQELQFIARENLPIKIILLNNNSLGMIRHFQEMYFDSKFVQTKKEYGYTTPNFEAIANAYGIDYLKIESVEEIENCREVLENNKSCFIEVCLSDTTYVFPKLAMGRPIFDQEPLLERELLDELMEMCNE
ncbi:MAG: thiamine pyrophosphate-binding protein [Cellulosilyticum sp.]|nr:thiamine pyrophosphate-binding protein [Cellulosilyticum sp.]